uniref:WH1 domain-containing protein n=1 Tax=Steinernema glaseri TaxID=37863 RepID=A0A1I7Z260_9BILA
MSEQVVASAMAEVMIYDEGVRNWVPVGVAMGISNLSQVDLMHNTRMNSFRIVATRIHDRSPVLNCNLYHRLKYVCPRSTFHQWRDEQRKVHGLSFSDHDQATNFASVVTEALGMISQMHNGHNGDHYSSYNDSASNGVYQEPVVNHLHHNANSAPVFRDADQDSICSNGQHLPNYRKSSHSIHSASGNAASLAAATPGGSISSSSLMNTLTSAQRRASQGSTTSSSNSSTTNVPQNGNAVYATSNGVGNHASSPCRTAPPPAPPLPPVSNGAPPPPAPPGPPPALSSNAPPAPPPPPANFLKAASKPQTLAEQLKQKAALRKVSASGNSEPGSKNEESKSAPKPMGGGGFLNELSAKLTLRKTAADGSASTSSSEAVSLERKTSAAADSSSISSNGVVKPWMKSNGSAPLDSPKSHRKAPSGSSLSSQEEPPRTAVAGSAAVVDMQQLKQEIMAEVRSEIRASEQRIIDAILAELRKH